MSIPSHILEQLNSQADLVGMIGKYTTLKRSGGTYRGKCPFHKGNSLSFSVNANKNVYHCFKCSVSGNAFTFLKEFENLTFIEAVAELAQQTGIDVPKEDNKDLRYKKRLPIAPSAASPTGSPMTAKASASKPPVSTAAAATPNHPNLPAAAGLSQIPQSAGFHSFHNLDSLDNANNFDSSNNLDSPDGFYNANHFDALTATPDYADYYHSDDPSNYHSNYPSNTAPTANEAARFVPYDANTLLNSSQNNGSQYSVNASANASGSSSVSASTDSEGNLYELLDKVSVFYQQQLHHTRHAMHYFNQRGLSAATIQTFALGYAPAGWQHLEQAFAADIDGLKALGLVRESAKGRDYNLLRDRVIFPIKDNQGRIIGFGGRALDNEVMPKYINSSDSPVFHKQHVLYGYYESRQHKAKNFMVVEGYMDVIALYQAGIYGAVASLGTAINAKQIGRLLQLNPVLTLSFDGDDAGQKAAWRTLEVALPVLTDDKELRFLSLPAGHDPDTYIRAHGVEAMREQIGQAVPLSQYVFAYLSERHDLTLAEGKAKLMAQVRELTAKLPKGSSFKHLLNNDIYQKISGRNRLNTTTAHDALLDFDSGMTSIDQLELCLLFNPHILQDDPILQLWTASGVSALPKPTVNAEVALPKLPSWQHFDDANLLKLVQVIMPLLPHLPDDTNSAAHFILANLPAQLQQELSLRWHSFWSNLHQRDIIEIKELTDELLIQLMLAALKQQLRQARNIFIIGFINKQQQTLSDWHKSRQAEQAANL